jgi:hypothetical protein
VAATTHDHHAPAKQAHQDVRASILSSSSNPGHLMAGHHQCLGTLLLAALIHLQAMSASLVTA